MYRIEERRHKHFLNETHLTILFSIQFQFISFARTIRNGVSREKQLFSVRNRVCENWESADFFSDAMGYGEMLTELRGRENAKVNTF